jgi:hypothetical protein
MGDTGWAESVGAKFVSCYYGTLLDALMCMDTDLSDMEVQVLWQAPRHNQDSSVIWQIQPATNLIGMF